MRRRSVTTRPLLLTVAATALVCALVPALASAQAGTAPEVTVDPTIAGTPREGQTLTTTARWSGDPAPTATWRWLRCSAAGDACSPIAGATSDRYLVATADGGSTLRARLTVTNSVGSDVHQSQPTAVVQGAATVPKPPPPPAPTPSPAPRPSVTPAPAPSSITSGA